MPTFLRASTSPAQAPFRGPFRKLPFRRGIYRATFAISGVTKDANGAVLAGCTVQLFRAGDNSLVATGVSDGGGNYTFNPPDNAGYFYVVAFKAGTPNVVGVSDMTLVAS